MKEYYYKCCVKTRVDFSWRKDSFSFFVLSLCCTNKPKISIFQQFSHSSWEYLILSCRYVVYFCSYIYVFFVTGARVNAKDSKWLTPLHRAVASCSEVCFLISFELLCIKIEYLKVPSVLCSLFTKWNYSKCFELQNTCNSLFNTLIVYVYIVCLCRKKRGKTINLEFSALLFA